MSSSQTHSTRTNPSSRAMSSPCFSICEAQPLFLRDGSDVPAEVQQELGQLELEVEYADYVVSVVAEIEILADISGGRIFAAYSVIHSGEPAVKIFVSAVAYAGAAVRFKLIVK